MEQGGLPASGHQDDYGSEGHQQSTGLGQGRIAPFPPSGQLKAKANEAGCGTKPSVTLTHSQRLLRPLPLQRAVQATPDSGLSCDSDREWVRGPEPGDE